MSSGHIDKPYVFTNFAIDGLPCQSISAKKSLNSIKKCINVITSCIYMCNELGGGGRRLESDATDDGLSGFPKEQQTQSGDGIYIMI